MKIRIDPHLQRFEVIQQLRDMILTYQGKVASGEIQDEEYSFTDYLYFRSLDPVKRFLMLCIPEGTLPEGVDYDRMIDYWSSKFQTFRGTTRIFEYLDQLSETLGVKIDGYRYTVEELEVTFGEVKTTDINLFLQSASDFFKSLLYFQEIIDIYNTIVLYLESNISVSLYGGSSFYSTYTITDYDEFQAI